MKSLRSLDWCLVTDVSGRLIGTGLIGCPKMSITINIRYVTSQKSGYLIDTAAETRNHAENIDFSRSVQSYHLKVTQKEALTIYFHILPFDAK